MRLLKFKFYSFYSCILPFLLFFFQINSTFAEENIPQLFIFDKAEVDASMQDEKRGIRLCRQHAKREGVICAEEDPRTRRFACCQMPQEKKSKRKAIDIVEQGAVTQRKAPLAKHYAGLNKNALINSKSVIFTLGTIEYVGRKIGTVALGPKESLNRYQLLRDNEPVGDASLAILNGKKKLRVEGSAQADGEAFTISSYDGKVRLRLNNPESASGSACGAENDAHSISGSQIAVSKALQRKAEASQVQTSAANGSSNIDLLVFYTEMARDRAKAQYNSRVPGVLMIEPQIRSLVDETNFYFDNSRVNARIKLLATKSLSNSQYNPEGSNYNTSQQLNQMASGGVPGIQEQRDNLKADLVMLLSEKSFQENGRSVGGRAYLFTGSDENGYSMVARDNITYGVKYLAMVFAHELGHNLGAFHDKENSQGSGYQPWSFGYRFYGSSGTLWRDIMAYPPGNFISFFSNPNVNFDGRPTGVNGQADVARTFNETAPMVASFRGVLQGKPIMNYLHSAGAGLGEKFTFICPAEGATSYVWKKNGKIIGDAKNKDLVFNPVKASDDGTYQCIATNQNGSVESRIADFGTAEALVITEQPLSNQVVKEGSTASLKVVSNAELVYWSKQEDDRFFAENPSIVFNSVRKKDSGTYICYVEKTYPYGTLARKECQPARIEVVSEANPSPTQPSSTSVPTVMPTKTNVCDDPRFLCVAPTATPGKNPTATAVRTATPDIKKTFAPTATPTRVPTKITTSFNPDLVDKTLTVGSLVMLECQLRSVFKPTIILDRLRGNEWRPVSSIDGSMNLPQGDRLTYYYYAESGDAYFRCRGKDPQGLFNEVTGRTAKISGVSSINTPTYTPNVPTATATRTPSPFPTTALPRWQNPLNRYDVNADGAVTEADAKVLSDFLNSNPANNGLLSQTSSPPPYLDVNGDGWASGIDLLQLNIFLRNYNS